MGFFDRLYYGKAGKKDYSEMDMPKTRLSLFFLVFRERFFDLIKVNLLQLVFWIPFLIWTALNVVAIMNIDVESVMATENGGLTLFAQMSSFMVAWLIGLIPCVLITGPSSAGSAHIMRDWARDQHAFLFSDFKDAFKENWKQALGVSTITGLAPVVVYAAMTYYGQMAERNLLMILPMIVVMSAVFMWTLMLPLLYPLMVGYQLSFKNLLRNAFLMAAARLPQMILARLITLIPIVALFLGAYFGNGIVMLVVIFYYLLIGFALSRLIYASIAHDIFDKYINPRIEGAAVGLGLRPQTADDDLLLDEDDEDEEDEQTVGDEDDEEYDEDEDDE